MHLCTFLVQYGCHGNPVTKWHYPDVIMMPSALNSFTECIISLVDSPFFYKSHFGVVLLNAANGSWGKCLPFLYSVSQVSPLFTRMSTIIQEKKTVVPWAATVSNLTPATWQEPDRAENGVLLYTARSCQVITFQSGIQKHLPVLVGGVKIVDCLDRSSKYLTPPGMLYHYKSKIRLKMEAFPKVRHETYIPYPPLSLCTYTQSYIQ